MVEESAAGWVEVRGEIVDAIRSGLFTGREVMDGLGISSGILGGWFRAEQTRRAKGSGAFTEVTLVGDAPRRSPRVEIRVRGGRRLRVPHGIDAAEISRLVRVLETC